MLLNLGGCKFFMCTNDLLTTFVARMLASISAMAVLTKCLEMILALASAALAMSATSCWTPLASAARLARESAWSLPYQSILSMSPCATWSRVR